MQYSNVKFEGRFCTVELKSLTAPRNNPLCNAACASLLSVYTSHYAECFESETSSFYAASGDSVIRTSVRNVHLELVSFSLCPSVFVSVGVSVCNRTAKVCSTDNKFRKSLNQLSILKSSTLLSLSLADDPVF